MNFYKPWSNMKILMLFHDFDVIDLLFFRKWPFSGEDDRGKTSPRALVFTRWDIQSERLYQEKKSFKYIP